MEKHVSWADARERALEKIVFQEYSKDEIRKHLEYLTTLIRRAGTDDELKASRYIKEKLDEFGIESEVHEVDAYISLPGEAELEILSPIQRSFPALPRAFIAPTPPEGIDAELVWVDKGLEEDYRGLDVKGKIVLVNVGGMEGRMMAARVGQQKGAAAQIHITPGRPRTINFGQFRTSWGPPTPETLEEIPRTPGISICREDGDYLSKLLQEQQVIVRLRADAWRGYRKIRIPVGILPGNKEKEQFVLVAGHYCSWFTGATDNAAANSMMIEMARIFSRHRKSLRRGIRFAWWSGHEQGCYAGSTWYLDHFWDDLRDHGVAYLVMDGLGREGSTEFTPQNTEEIRKFQERIIKETLGLEVRSKRPPRFGDQSYCGLGLPSMTGNTLSEKGVWYSHAAEDTLDKVDIDLLAIPFKVYSTAALRLCNSPVLPFEFTPMIEMFRQGLEDLAENQLDGTRPVLLIESGRRPMQEGSGPERGHCKISTGAQETWHAPKS